MGASDWRRIGKRCGPQQHGVEKNDNNKQNNKTKQQKPVRETANERERETDRTLTSKITTSHQ